MSIPFSYITTTAWEKFVEKHDAFMRNSNTKVENGKTNTKLCFHLKWWFWTEFGLFCSRFTTSPSWPSDAPLSLDHPGIQCLNWPFRIWIIWDAWCAWTSIWLRTSWTNPSPSGHLQWCDDDGFIHSVSYLRRQHYPSWSFWQRPYDQSDANDITHVTPYPYGSNTGVISYATRMLQAI